METIYRKVILNIVDRCFHMYASDYRKEAKEYAIEKLEAEKKELLEALYFAKRHCKKPAPVLFDKIESLIQKYKK